MVRRGVLWVGEFREEEVVFLDAGGLVGDVFVLGGAYQGQFFETFQTVVLGQTIKQ